MSIKQNRDLMVENIKKVRTQLSEDQRMSRSDQNDLEFNSFKKQGNVKKAAQIAAEEAIKMGIADEII